MPALTINTANALLNAVLRSTTYTSPGAVYLAAYTTAPSAAAGTGVEVTGGSYARAQITFGAAANGACSNAAEIDITGMPAVTIRGLAIMDASTGGNMLFYGVLATPKSTNAGDTLVVKVNDLNCALS